MYICMYVSVCMYIISLPYTRNITNWCFNFVSWITFTHLISHHRSPIMRVERPLVAMSASSTMRYHVSAELKGKIYSGITLRWRHKTWRYFKICDISITFLKSWHSGRPTEGGTKGYPHHTVSDEVLYSFSEGATAETVHRSTYDVTYFDLCSDYGRREKLKSYVGCMCTSF